MVVDGDPEPPPSPFLQADPDGADRARQKLAPRTGLARLLSKRFVVNRTLASSASSSQLSSQSQPTPEQNVQVALDTPISLDATALIGADGDISHDQYQWAVMYENQRGITAFSIPYYSSLSLLPVDPAPYTLPGTSSQDASHQPPVTPNAYPLPDGTWRWISRSWMIDMRSESTQGQVQHDGFEYNWAFRKHSWKAQVGPLNFCGWVRRRRWVRLMVRPATKNRNKEGDLGHDSIPNSPASYAGTPASALLLPINIRDVYGTSTARSSPLPPRANRTSHISSHPSSLMSVHTELSARSSVQPDEVWTGTDTDADWERCRALMKRFGRDGRKLELWKLWFGFYHPDHKEKFKSTAADDDNEDEGAKGTKVDKGKQRQKQWTEDDEPLPSEVIAAEILLSKETVAVASREHMIPVLRTHTADILHLFIFPDSRAQFLKLLSLAGLLAELNLSLDSGTAELDFWSYTSGLADLPGAQTALKLKSTPGGNVVEKLKNGNSRPRRTSFSYV